MIPETSALYRQVALALEAKGVTGLMDACPRTALHNNRHGVRCAVCGGARFVAPLEAECFYRLTIAYKGVAVGMNWEGTLWRASMQNRCYDGTSPLTALLRATAAALGIEAQEAAE